MKPTTEQKEFLRKALTKTLLYRETYTEFYDHILSALEAKPGNMFLQDAIERIIEDDFGGHEGMREIESRYKKTTTKEIQKKYLAYITAYFKFPQIGITLMLTILFYWIAEQSWFGFGVFMGLFLIMRMTPSILRRGRNIFAGYIFTNPRSSVKDGVFEWLEYISFIFFALFIVCGRVYEYSPIDWFKKVSPAILTLVLVPCALHTLAYYKVYKNEFKINIAQ